MDQIKEVYHTLRRMNIRTLLGQTVQLGASSSGF